MPTPLNPSFSNASPLDLTHVTHVEETSPQDRTTHTGSCHCGAITYTVTLKHPFPKYPVNACSCSACSHHGYLFVYPCRRDFEITQGEENLSEYRFNTHTKAHKFCKNCGSSLLIDFRLGKQGEGDWRKDILAVNVRHFDDIDLDKLEYTYFDGKRLIPSKE